MPFYHLTLGILAVWRVTHLLYAEDGPWNAITALRQWAGAGVLGEAMDCFLCLSLWLSIPPALALGPTWRERCLLWPALSAGAILLHRLTHPEPQEPENVLRQIQEPPARPDPSAAP